MPLRWVEGLAIIQVQKVKLILKSRLMNYGTKMAKGAGCVIGVRKGEDIIIEGQETK
jgi:hypothetical protein